ncbi:RHS repeat domain-containing protein [Pleionea litopenaei]|uniref:RHS repeat-associated core domain-containing protein n=1 Tax=Pleionea litopenaei TaxID=3070815 RepID=A0AA51RTW9_9GAMM|nr:RHS repeat-associated core domain-containing protein [Pleionea sp. HL-JVS1]WMS87510.1 RHS repeat-associated core domain-containing protein [Pleionea sp. HL-JVS1]
MHRLKSSALIVDGIPRQSIDYDYDKVGNLKTKSDFSTVNGMSYGNGSRSEGNAGPNAVLSVTLANSAGTRTYEYDLNGNLENDKLNGAQLRHIDYNAFNKPTLITVSGGHKLSPLDQNTTGASTTAFFYGADQMRFKQVKTTSGEVETTLYVGKVYEEVITSNRTEKKVFIDDIAMQTEIIENGTTEFKIGFFHKDRLGSTVAISDETGSNIQFRSFDPFGKPREGNLTRSPNAIIGSDLYKRGFTDHEHLDDSQLIHMNGRAYDYNLGRFLSVDPFVQDPGNSQSMNPYSYIMNNPLAGTDPSGYLACEPGTPQCKIFDDPLGYVPYTKEWWQKNFSLNNGDENDGDKTTTDSKLSIEDIGSPNEIVLSEIEQYRHKGNYTVTGGRQESGGTEGFYGLTLPPMSIGEKITAQYQYMYANSWNGQYVDDKGITFFDENGKFKYYQSHAERSGAIDPVFPVLELTGVFQGVKWGAYSLKALNSSIRSPKGGG